MSLPEVILREISPLLLCADYFDCSIDSQLVQGLEQK